VIRFIIVDDNIRSKGRIHIAFNLLYRKANTKFYLLVSFVYFYFIW